MSEAGYDVDIRNSAGGDGGDDDNYNHQHDRPQDSGPHGRNSADIDKTMTKKKKNKKKKRMIQFHGRGNGGAGDPLEAKPVALFPFAKAKKHLLPPNNTNSRKRPPSSTTSSAAAVPKATICCFPIAASRSFWAYCGQEHLKPWREVHQFACLKQKIGSSLISDACGLSYRSVVSAGSLEMFLGDTNFSCDYGWVATIIHCSILELFQLYRLLWKRLKRIKFIFLP